MKKLMIALLAFLPVIVSLEAGIVDQIKGIFVGEEKIPKETVKILVVRDEPGIVLEVNGKHRVQDPKTGQPLSNKPGSKRRIAQATEGGIKWGEEFQGVFQLHIIPNDSSVISTIDGVEYPGSIYVYNVDGKISIVSEVGIEEFLKLQLGNQFQMKMPNEAFAAVVIAARTDVLYHAKHPKNEFWSIDGLQIGYRGLNGAKPIKSLSKALAETEHMIMQNGHKNQAPFAPQWGIEFGPKGTDHGVIAQITVDEAKEMARRGENAKEILNRAFPNTEIALIP